MNNKFDELSKSELDLLSKFNCNYDSSNPVLTKIIEHIIYNYNKLNNEIITSKYQNKVLVDKIENILIGSTEPVKSSELEAKSTEYALTLLKQHIEVVKLNEELQHSCIES